MSAISQNKDLVLESLLSYKYELSKRLTAVEDTINSIINDKGIREKPRNRKGELMSTIAEILSGGDEMTVNEIVSNLRNRYDIHLSSGGAQVTALLNRMFENGHIDKRKDSGFITVWFVKK